MSLVNPISVPPEGLRDTRAAAGWHPLGIPLSGVDRLRAEVLRADRLALRQHREWATLSQRAAPGNVFAADWLMAPAMARAGERLQLATVRDTAGTWLGAMPVGRARLGPHAPLPVLRSWHCPEGGIGTPLLRPGAERAFWEALLARLDRRPGLAAGLVVSALPLDDPATLALASLCAEQGRFVGQFPGAIRRARIAGQPGDRRAVKVMERRLAQLEARLTARIGPVQLALHSRPGDCEPWLAAFLALERGAGRARLSPETLRGIVRAAHRRGAVRLASLRAGETIVAMSAWLVTEGRGFGLASVHDTRLAAFAPHHLVMRRVAELAALEGLTRFDIGPGCNAGSDALWPEARAFADFAVAIGSRTRRALFARAVRARLS